VPSRRMYNEKPSDAHTRVRHVMVLESRGYPPPLYTRNPRQRFRVVWDYFFEVSFRANGSATPTHRFYITRND